MARIIIFGPFAKSLISFRGDLIKEFVAAGHEVIALAPEKGYERQLSELGAKYIHVSMERAAINPLADIFLLSLIIKIFREKKPDAVFNYAIKPVIYGSIAARISGIKSIYSMITGLGYIFIGNSLKQRFLRIIVKSFYKKALSINEKVFFQNPDDLSEFIKHNLIEKQKTVLINGSGVNVDEYQYKSPLLKPVTFLLIGRLLWDKGIGEYVEAARIVKKRYPQAKFLLLGPYDSNPRAITKKDIDAWVAENTVDYLGEKDDVRPYIASSSIYVLPSYREGTPRSVLEAMSMGRAIITTDVPGCKETVINGYNGLLIPAKEPNLLASAMEYFILNSSQIVSMGINSRELVLNKYNVKSVNQLILENINLTQISPNTF